MFDSPDKKDYHTCDPALSKQETLKLSDITLTCMLVRPIAKQACRRLVTGPGRNFFSSRICKLIATRALADLWLLHHSSRITSARATAQGGCFCMLSKLEMIRSAIKGPTAIEVQEASLNTLCNRPDLGSSCYLELLYTRWAERQAQTQEHSVTSMAHAEL